MSITELCLKFQRRSRSFQRMSGVEPKKILNKNKFLLLQVILMTAARDGTTEHQHALKFKSLKFGCCLENQLR